MDSETLQILISALLIIGGTVMLYFGAEGLVTGSSSVAVRAGITPFVIGITIVGFGTSSPELVVSVTAALKGNGGISLGNVIGSNICNIALILGLSAIIRPINVEMKSMSRDMFIMIAVSLLLIIFLLDGQISRLEGVIFFVLLMVFLSVTVHLSRKVIKNNNKEQNLDHHIKISRPIWLDILFILGGLGILIVGADFFLKGSIKVANMFGIPDVIIGLTLVALGTSLPELATSVVASIKKQSDISLGNIIGSNIFNILCIIGIASMLSPISTNEISPIDLSVMIGLSLVIVPMSLSRKIGRASCRERV